MSRFVHGPWIMNRFGVVTSQPKPNPDLPLKGFGFWDHPDPATREAVKAAARAAGHISTLQRLDGHLEEVWTFHPTSPCHPTLPKSATA